MKRRLAPLFRWRRWRRCLEEARRLTENPTIRYAPPGHFYSPLPDPVVYGDPSHLAHRRDLASIPEVELREAAQFELLEQLEPHFAAFPWDRAEHEEEHRFHFRQSFFREADALALYGMLRLCRPRRIIEVGSGFTSALMLDVADELSDWSPAFTFVEPHSERLRSLLRLSDEKTARVIEKPVQEVDVRIFDKLQSGDLLFIDSSHVSKVGSDVNHLFFEVWPRLEEGVIVHIHDIFWPFEYPPEWIREGRAWNEAYLLRAFLAGRRDGEILLWNSYLGRAATEWLSTHAPRFLQNTGGSIYLRKTSRAVRPT